MRLAPDMFALSKQIQIATDSAKAAAATLSGKEAPAFEDKETTMLELRQRVQKCIAYLETFKAQDFEKNTDKTIIKVAYPAGMSMYAPEALISRAIPNFFFHVTTAYAILRMGGVQIGKKDFLGQLNMMPA
jgi:hypothetical protein